MNRQGVVICCGLMVATLAVSKIEHVHAQAYPTKPIRIVTAPVGGANDFAARLIAPALSGSLGQPVIIDNRAGVLAGGLVAKAAPDGHTLLLFGSTIWLLPLFSTAPYDVANDFSPITTTNNAANVLVVHPSLPARSVGELIAIAKARPGDLHFATGAEHSSSPYLAGILFNTLAGVRIAPVPYKGVGPALIGVITGEVHMAFPTGGSVKGHIGSGKLRALGISSAKPSRLYPGLPTIAASLPGYESTSIWGVLAPARTPPPIIDRLNQEIARVLTRSDIIERFLNAGMDTEVSTPQQLGAVIKADTEKWTRIKNSGTVQFQ